MQQMSQDPFVQRCAETVLQMQGGQQCTDPVTSPAMIIQHHELLAEQYGKHGAMKRICNDIGRITDLVQPFGNRQVEKSPFTEFHVKEIP